jgi:UDP-GlcNAc:undecaprenyl-phosphate GlcNAc-1-phosphate transferase
MSLFFIITFATLTSLFFNYFFNYLFLKRNKIDQINSRSSHSVVATKSGGIAIFFSLSTITIFFYANNKEIFDFSLLLPLSIIFITGVYDDFYNANFKLKFFLQIIVAKLLIDQGFIINNLHGLFGIYQIPHLISQFITVFIFIIIVNAINFTDGIDGLASILVIYFLIAFEFLMGFDSTLVYFNLISILIILPFFLFNSRKNNKVFLGDAGSLFLGSLIAINTFNFLNINIIQKSFYNGALVSIAILIYPLFDLLRVFVIRVKKGNSPFIADKNHLHHKLSFLINNHYLRSIIILTLSFLFLILTLIIEFNFSSIYTSLFLILCCLILLRK